MTGDAVIAAAWLGDFAPTAGDTGDPLSLSAVTSSGAVRAVTAHQAVETYGPGGQVTESTVSPGDFLAGATASVPSGGRTCRAPCRTFTRPRWTAAR